MIVWLVVSLGLALLIGWHFRRRASLSFDQNIMREFGIDPDEFTVLGADVGGHSRKLILRANGTIGAPDAAFASRDGTLVLIGEVKSRTYRGHLTDYERNQVTLYLGAAHQRFPGREIRGAIRYPNHLVSVTYDPALYDRLLGFIDLFRRASRAFR